MTNSDQNPNDNEPPLTEAVTITLYAHWNCPACQHENAVRLAGTFPVQLTCGQCGRKARTLESL